ncbi:hypothetical protein OV208_22685 [Corallococcus sp. bb12-1]|uniref:hypothetical protein n=1 Tax=Corallococcus sp. bb12-1 TaxID=2996784 RepID=UPI00226E356C|nr:hypothetical protein [Corallococcus sp. bb12-1]MCY1044142.1 hypothetical protein [Corallococcus sp. bb12-1]
MESLMELRYFKHVAESEHGEGFAFLEVVDGWPRRQIEVYGAVWRWGDAAHPEWLADQPLTELDLGEEHEVPAAVLERTREEALRRCPRPL